MIVNSFALCLLIIVLVLPDIRAAAQEGPGIVIAHPGQGVELLCTVTVTDSGSQAAAWLIINMGPYRMNAIRAGLLVGYAATLISNNLIVENIMMNDDRNGSDYRCVIVPAQGTLSLANIIEESDPTILYVAGVPTTVPHIIATVDDNAININRNNVTVMLSWGEPFNNLDLIVNYTVSCSGDVKCPSNFTTTDSTTRSYTITNLTTMTNYTFSVVATNSIGSGEAGVVMITTPSISVNTTSNEWIIIIIIVFFLTFSCCGCMCIMFCVCCKQRENNYQSEKLCANPRSSFVVFVILGILTFGISLLIWYIYLKCQSNEKDNYYKITNVSIFVLGIFTCGISVLLWWMYKAITECNISTSEDSSVAVSYQRRQANEVPSVFNQLAEYDDTVHIATSPTKSIQKSVYKVPSVITDKTDKRLQTPPSYAAVSTEDVIARERAAASASQASIRHQITGSGEKYALPDKLAAKNKPIIAHQKDTTDAQQAIQCQNTASEGKYAIPEVVVKDKSIKYVKMEELCTSERTHTNDDVFTPYAEIC